MRTIAILMANDPPSPHGLVPICLETILGDPILLWQLRALPNEIARIHVVTGCFHERAAKLVSDFNNSANRNVECHHGQGLLGSLLGLLDMLKAAAGEPDAQILLLGTDQPLLNHAAIKSLMAQTGAWRLSPSGPVSLNLAELKTAVEQLRQRNPEADSDCLLSHLEETVRPRALECDPQCLLRVKTRRDLVQAQAIAKKHIVEGWLDSGVAFSDPDSAHIGPRVRMAPKGVVIEPNVRLEGEIVVGEGTTIGQGVIVRDAKLGAGVEVRPYCVIDSSIVGDGAKIGPFAHLRLGTLLDSDVHLGNFVETKKAHMRAGAKANHLSYLGDCEVGEKTNVGAGCITCNYDGFNKHRTVIGKNVFVGSDCQLVAPVTVGDGALLAAGTTLTKDVPKDALVLTRPETTIKEGSAERLRAKLRRQKEQGTGNRG